MHWIAGVDEVGRGPLYGPVVAAAVILDPRQPVEGLADSKKLSAKTRERLASEIRQKAAAWHITEVSSAQIDELNIHHATLLAMSQAVRGLNHPVAAVYVDGKFTPPLGNSIPVTAFVKGDSLKASISAASILAKVYRDQMMDEEDLRYPEYGFAAHKGYPTARHLAAIREYGILPLHRRSYQPVRLLAGLA